MNQNLRDSPEDLARIQARNYLVAHKDDLDGLLETTSELTAIMSHLDALKTILSATVPKIDFSSVTKGDLANVGIQRKYLRFDHTQLDNLLTHERAAPAEQIQQLCTRIAQIYRHFGMNCNARRIVDAILLTVAGICADGDAKLPAAILPEIQIASGDGVLLKNPATSFEMRFTGTVDYVVCTYEDEEDALLSPHSSRSNCVLNADIDTVARFARFKIFLRVIERDEFVEDKTIYDFMPETISQAAAFCEVTGTTAVRFCVTDGRNWLFSLFSKDGSGARVSYQGNVTTILQPRFDEEGRDPPWEESIHRIVELVYHWLVAEQDPLTDVLYRFKE
ncbi:hypothetical protein C8F01DRAFT_1365424 [Mycena amicta]|nr:hypothetical protein C8F01DRAFT_1365424 [Mycena amicta]